MEDSRNEFVREVEAFIASGVLLAEGHGVAVGVSGGADSVALAAALRSTGRFTLHLVHVHHGLRGAAADADAAFVRELAWQWKLPFILKRIDTPSLARQWGVGVEEAARRGRYDALTEAAREAGASAVAVAHHADDQVETVLHRIVRGTHLRGLGGMPAKRPLAEGVSLVRPLLWARRRQVEQYCRSQGLSWRTDHTNAQLDHTRNFIRHELLPLLRDRLNPRADEALLRLSSAAGEAEAALDDLSGRLFERACRKRLDDRIVLRVAPLRKAPPVLASLVFRAALAELSAPQQALTQERFNDLLEVLAGRAAAVDLPGEIRVARQGQSICISRGQASGGKSD